MDIVHAMAVGRARHVRLIGPVEVIEDRRAHLGGTGRIERAGKYGFRPGAQRRHIGLGESRRVAMIEVVGGVGARRHGRRKMPQSHPRLRYGGIRVAKRGGEFFGRPIKLLEGRVDIFGLVDASGRA